MPCWGKFINCRSEIIKVKLHKYTGVYNASAHVNFWLFFMRLPRQVEHKFTDSLWRHPEPRWRQSTHVSAINCVVHIVDTSALASHQPSTAIAVSVMQIKKNKTKRKTKHKHTVRMHSENNYVRHWKLSKTNSRCICGNRNSEKERISLRKCADIPASNKARSEANGEHLLRL